MTTPDTERHRLYSSYGDLFLLRVLALGLLMRMLISHCTRTCSLSAYEIE
jgi:hypothetical protein